MDLFQLQNNFLGRGDRKSKLSLSPLLASIGKLKSDIRRTGFDFSSDNIHGPDPRLLLKMVFKCLGKQKTIAYKFTDCDENSYYGHERCLGYLEGSGEYNYPNFVCTCNCHKEWIKNLVKKAKGKKDE